MLFDLRGRGRRRTVQVIYIGLALLMGLSLVGLGIGSLGGGGILSGLGSNEGSSSASFSAQIKKYEKLTKQQPANASAWENLAKAQLHEAGGEAFVSPTAGVSAKGKELYAQVASSWNHYLALNPRNPNPELAQQMVTVFGEEGLDQPAEAVKTLQIVVAARPESAALYAALAEYAYKAHNVSVGDLASEKAISLAPAGQRPRLKTELAALKKNPNPSTETSTATGAGGKTFDLKSSGNGKYTATPSKGASGLTSSTK
jgi:hypothetical protein